MKEFFKTHPHYRNMFQGRKIMLFLDFDGTLADIADHYKNATILEQNKSVLKALLKDPKTLTAVVSGRALSDVKKKVGLKKIIYVGNHGLEIEGQDIKYTVFIEPRIKSALQKIKSNLLKKTNKIPGVFIEDKALTLSAHYRRVKATNIPLLRKTVLDTIRPYLTDKKISTHKGKRIFEIRPVINWNKGEAVLWLLKHFNKITRGQKIYPIFIGDDITDETAFKALHSKGLCLRVGQNKTSLAPFFLKNTAHVTRFLKVILNSKGALS